MLTTHSLEPHRPWKVEQLGTGYQASTWVEKTAYQNADGVIAVSEAMSRDVHELYQVPDNRIKVIYNGIDPAEYRKTVNRSVLLNNGIDPKKPYVLFVGRITRQKGIIHLVNAIKSIQPGVQVVLCRRGTGHRGNRPGNEQEGRASTKSDQKPGDLDR